MAATIDAEQMVPDQGFESIDCMIAMLGAGEYDEMHREYKPFMPSAIQEKHDYYHGSAKGMQLFTFRHHLSKNQKIRDVKSGFNNSSFSAKPK